MVKNQTSEEELPAAIAIVHLLVIDVLDNSE